jgi:hypothetical protein
MWLVIWALWRFLKAIFDACAALARRRNHCKKHSCLRLMDMR